MPRATGLTFNHAMIYVRRLAPALRLYRDQLGFKLIEKFPGYARLRSPRGQTTLALHRLEPGMKQRKAEGIRLYFETKNLGRLCQRLARAGVKFSQKPRLMPWGWSHAYLKDPDGHELSLYGAGEKRLRKSRM
ncbi:MAG: VOC family protein [Acidobacteria bacterium]|nr:VOC family protein [Acidobacteriota bacterium]